MNIKELELDIEKAYKEDLTIDEAEKLAAKFLHAQILISQELKKADLDSRMRKAGVKSIRAALYLNIIQTSEKKPTEAQIDATINIDDIVGKEQENFDKSEVNKAELERMYEILINAHIYFRALAKGRFE